MRARQGEPHSLAPHERSGLATHSACPESPRHGEGLHKQSGPATSHLPGTLMAQEHPARLVHQQVPAERKGEPSQESEEPKAPGSRLEKPSWIDQPKCGWTLHLPHLPTLPSSRQAPLPPGHPLSSADGSAQVHVCHLHYSMDIRFFVSAPNKDTGETG